MSCPGISLLIGLNRDESELDRPLCVFLEASDTGIIFTGAGRPCGSRIEFEESPVDEPVAAVSFVESSPNATKELSSTFDESVTEVFDSTAFVTNGSEEGDADGRELAVARRSNVEALPLRECVCFVGGTTMGLSERP